MQTEATNVLPAEHRDVERSWMFEGQMVVKVSWGVPAVGRSLAPLWRMSRPKVLIAKPPPVDNHIQTFQHPDNDAVSVCDLSTQF